MYRSWAYILMLLATLVAVVALVWPAPTPRTIEEIAAPERPAPRAEGGGKPPKGQARAQAPKPAPKPPTPASAAAKKAPASTTVGERKTVGGTGPSMGGAKPPAPKPPAPKPPAR